MIKIMPHSKAIALLRDHPFNNFNKQLRECAQKQLNPIDISR
jgi:hypothetical protein